MGKKILVSIIVPIYNAEKFLDKCIHSILSNDFDDIEILLLDDGSKDQSFQKISEFNHEAIRVFHHDNRGVSFTRNKGIKEAKGDYLIFLDSDDFIDKEYISTLYRAVKGNDIGISGIRFLDNKYQKIGERLSVNNRWNPFNLPLSGGKIYRRLFLTENSLFFSDFKIGEDLLFNSNNCALTNKVVNIEYTGYNYVENNDSSTHSRHNDLDLQNLIDAMKKSITNSAYLNKKDCSFFLSKTVIDLSYYSVTKDNLISQSKKLNQAFHSIEAPVFQWNTKDSLLMNMTVNLFSISSKMNLSKIPLGLMVKIRK